MSAVNEIIEKLKTLSLLEASELVSQIEETFGVDASAPAGGAVMMAAMPGGGDAAAAVEEKTTFDVILEDIPADKKSSNLQSCTFNRKHCRKPSKRIHSNFTKSFKRRFI